jgi:NADPH-dependent 2,4-dienoyl-CoA reductase/sulfur reductase-like enzyme
MEGRFAPMEGVKRPAVLLLSLACCVPPFPGRSGADVVVYGATPGGICAAIAAARLGRTVVLLEPTPRIGGMATHGLSHTDFRTFEGITGQYFEAFPGHAAP